ncbi:coiled-coil domain-containing protein 66 [Pholidichthys leucotaenia]
MNLGDRLLFELENGKPKLILLSHGVDKNPAKLSFRPRGTKILSSRQPSYVEEAQREERPSRQLPGGHMEGRSKASGGGAAISFTSNISNNEGRSTSLNLSTTRDRHKAGGIKSVAKVKPNQHKAVRANGNADQPQKHVKVELKHTSPNRDAGLKDSVVKPNQHKALRANGNADQAQKLVKVELKHTSPNGDAGLKDSVVCLTNEQLQHILSTVQTSNTQPHPPEDPREPGDQTGSKPESDVTEGEMKEVEGVKTGGGGADSAGRSQEKDNGLAGCMLSWMDEHQRDSRMSIDAKKAQWRKELDEQVALKQQQQQQQRSAPGTLQGTSIMMDAMAIGDSHHLFLPKTRMDNPTGPNNSPQQGHSEGTKALEKLSQLLDPFLTDKEKDSVSMEIRKFQADDDSQSSVTHREHPAAIRSSLRLGEVTPMEEEALNVERREEQRRRWLEELNRQRDEAVERRRREKLLQSQAEDLHLWNSHFDSFQRRPPATSAPNQNQNPHYSSSEGGDWEPSSSLSLVWEAKSVGGASVDTARGYPTRTSYLRTMTSLLDPAQIEERERRRLKQLEQQRAIKAQVEEHRQQREQEEARRRQEEEEEERRMALQREELQRRHERETLREKQKKAPVQRSDEPKKDGDEMSESSPAPPSRVDAIQTQESSAQYEPPPAPPLSSRSRAGKENIIVLRGDDPYEPFVRVERSRREKRRPEWNSQRPSRRFVPASERYPADLQRHRLESRLKRQTKLLALQERTHVSRTAPPPPSPEEHHLCSRTSPSRTGENVSTPHRDSNTDRGRAPPVPTVRHRVQNQQTSSTPPSLALEFVPYLRTAEVVKLDPLEPTDPPQLQPHSAPPQSSSASPPSHRDTLLHPELLRNSHRQKEILRGLAQLRQGLLQKQRELETTMNRPPKHHDWFPSKT